MGAVRQLIEASLRERYPATANFDAGKDVIAAFKGPPGLGDLEIIDDGDGATVVFGQAAHTHFQCLQPGVADKDKADSIAGELLEFLADVFAGNVVIWTIPGKESCITYLDVLSQDPPDEARIYFTWEGRFDPKQAG